MGNLFFGETSNLESKSYVWNRQRGESDKAYKAFLLYRDAGLDRTLKKVAEMLNKSVQNVGRWCVRWNWRHRLEAWDRHVQELEAHETIQLRLEHRRLSLQIAKDLATKAAQGVRALELVRVGTDGKEHLAVKPADLMRVIESVYKVQNSMLGKSDEDQVAKIEVVFGSTEDDDSDEED